MILGLKKKKVKATINDFGPYMVPMSIIRACSPHFPIIIHFSLILISYFLPYRAFLPRSKGTYLYLTMCLYSKVSISRQNAPNANCQTH